MILTSPKKVLLMALLAATVTVSVGVNQPSHAGLWPFKKQAEPTTEQAPMPADITAEDGAQSAAPQQSPDALTAPISEETASEEAPMALPPEPYREPEAKVQVMSPLTRDASYGLTVADPVISTDAPPSKVYVTVDDPKNPLGITTSAERLNKVTYLIETKKYAEAKVLLEPLMQWLVDSTEAHINLNKTLSKIPSAKVQSELEKQLALQFAMLRDKAFFNRAMIAIGENKPSEAVKHLSRVVQSQPRSPIGLKSYELLQQIGFTEKIQLQ